MARWLALALTMLAIACSGSDKSANHRDSVDSSTQEAVDADGDGYDATEDCDDNDAQVNPSAVEICDGIDNNCDDQVDEGVQGTYYTDSDGDGFGDADSPIYACSVPAGAVAVGNDCDDTNPDAYPGAQEVCDGADNNCDGITDEGAETTWYADADGDGYGDATVSQESCDAPAGTVANDTDCDDTTAAAHPGATELCDGLDNDCDGEIDEDSAADVTTFYEDRDEDGFGDATRTVSACEAPAGYVADDTDCDDLVAVTYPGADELCDGADNDCDGEIDEDAVDAGSWYIDSDGDGYGDPASVVVSCDLVSGTVSSGGDCDDADASVHPSATETCNGVDDDCDGVVDEDAVGASTWYADADGDGYGDPASAAASCSAPVGYVPTATDCDDGASAVHPGATEICDGLDNDCDGSVDEVGASDAPTWYEDRDEDGYGDPTRAEVSCDAPSGYVSDDTDCDDLSVGTHPGADELCDGLDNDCDGTIDEGAVDGVTWYTDGDGDGYGDPSSETVACDAPSGAVASDTDCDDADASVHPGATETCNGKDDDCDGAIDETGATDASTWYVDSDSDGYGDAASSTTACDAPAGYVSNKTDCDDSASSIHPGADEVCDGVDNDCDGSIDESSAVDASTWYEDRDGDGYGDPARTTVSCSAPSGYVANNTDCDDLAVGIHPGADEVCDGKDNDCDGVVDDGATDASTWYTDSDGDGYGDASSSSVACDAPSGSVASDTDCDDTDARVHPGATETCNGVDDNCNGAIDEASATDAPTWYADSDGDGYGNASVSKTACDAPSGYVSNKTDCNDSAAAINPGATEVCDGVDNDCDGSTDESSAVDASTWYQDRDEDGYGDPARTKVSCTMPSGYVATNTDCDDLAAGTHPGATEVCDEKDNDCDGVIDDSAVDASTWYTDSDGDGYGNAASSSVACDAPSGTVASATDCNDANASVHPGATETCNGIDDNCDGSIDEATASDASTWYADSDGDGYGNASVSKTACDDPTGYVSNKTDCNDSAAAIHPGATEVCDGVDNNCDGSIDEASASDAVTWYQDRDEDGYGDPARTRVACTAPTGYVANNTDCDDLAVGTHPGATEVCDDKDNDCDGVVDDSAVDASTWYTDSDGDGYGNAASSSTACDAPSGTVASSTDCNDADSSVHPGAPETCNGKDDNCDGTIDEASAVDASTWYADSDGDGYGNASVSKTACTTPTGYVSNKTDCNDSAAAVNPAATEVCDGIDNDCDGSTDEASAADAITWYQDRDEDGYGDPARTKVSCSEPSGYVATNTDCDDLAVGIHPGAAEICDGKDNDCDGTIDDSAVDASTWYTDADGDGYGNAASATVACDAPSGTVAASTDCNDSDASVHPGATETCNGKDDNCDGSIDEATASDAKTWYADSDGDGYGNASVSKAACDAPSGYVSNKTDCNDSAAGVNPAATEVCDGIDNDCDGSIDEASAADATTWYQDRDEDGYGDPARTSVSCTAPTGYVADGTDCNDLAVNVNPGEDEVCDGVDNDCDGTVDNDATDASIWYADSDGDGYGNLSTAVRSCTAPTGYIAEHTDCDDTNASVHPGATEICDGIDNNCDGLTDDSSATGITTWYVDSDGDGYGSAATSKTSCTAPTGYVADKTDCDDSAAAVHPGATEICDGIDNNCDGLTDDSTATGITTWYADSDGDGYGDSTKTKVSCTKPTGYVSVGTDCNDTSAAAHPGGTEICDGLDNDCNGTVDDSATDAGTWYTDADGDGYGSKTATGVTACTAPTGTVSNRTDCNDSCATCHPFGTEVCDGLDNDCDGLTDEAGATGTTSYYPDADGDGYGSETGTAVKKCSAPSGYTADNTDCDDTHATINPGETETCDGTDNDCSGDEDGVVTFTSTTGTVTDMSSIWASGTDGAPKSIAASTSGTFEVCPGTYYVSITASASSLTFDGPYGASETVLSGGGSQRTMVSTKTLKLSGVTLSDGYNATLNGANLNATGTVTATNVVIERGSAQKGGNVSCSACKMTLNTVDIIDGDAVTNGGGMYLLSGATLTATSVNIDGNTADYGGGMYIMGAATTATMTGSTISNNSASTAGGGVYQDASTLKISSVSNIEKNSASYLGGGLSLSDAATFTCTGSSSTVAGVWGNTALAAGGVAMSTSDHLTSNVCDWTASKDNTTYDLVVYDATLLIVIGIYTVDDNASFTCGASGC